MGCLPIRVHLRWAVSSGQPFAITPQGRLWQACEAYTDRSQKPGIARPTQHTVCGYVEISGDAIARGDIWIRSQVRASADGVPVVQVSRGEGFDEEPLADHLARWAKVVIEGGGHTF